MTATRPNSHTGRNFVITKMSDCERTEKPKKKKKKTAENTEFKG